MNPRVREVVREARCMYLNREQTAKFAARVLPDLSPGELNNEIDEFLLEQAAQPKEYLDA